MDKVIILMAAWQGEKFLKEQIDSILAQDSIDLQLIVRDDASKDSTLEILYSYARRFPDKVVVYENKENIGATKNFLNLLCAAEAENKDKNIYYMFSDQDDFWHHDKVRKTLRRIKHIEKKYGENTPLLVFTDSEVVDPSGVLLADSFCRQQHYNVKNRSFAHLLMENICQGCTMMWNMSLAEKIKIPKEDARYHDWWVALTAAAFGKISFLPQATMQYRQHENNVVGADCFGTYVQQRMKNRKEQKLALAATFRQAEAFKTCYKEELDQQKKQLLQKFCKIPKQGAFARRKTVVDCGFYKSGLARNIGLFLNL